MKRQRRMILLVILSAALIVGIYLFAGRMRPLPGMEGDLEWISVQDNRTNLAVAIELSDGEADALKMKLKALKMKWSGSYVHTFSIENVQFFVDYIVDQKPFHLVLGEPCFAYESAGKAQYPIVQDDAYRRLMEELQSIAEP